MNKSLVSDNINDFALPRHRSEWVLLDLSGPPIYTDIKTIHISIWPTYIEISRVLI